MGASSDLEREKVATAKPSVKGGAAAGSSLIVAIWNPNWEAPAGWLGVTVNTDRFEYFRWLAVRRAQVK